MAKRSRAWCFTLNTAETDPLHLLVHVGDLLGRRGFVFETTGQQNDLRYACYQAERGVLNDSLHIQGYFECRNCLRMCTVRKLLPGAHVEIALGTAVQNTTYCTREDKRVPGTDAVVLGNIDSGGQGRRSDIAQFITKAQENGLDAAIESFPEYLIRYPRGVEAWRQHQQRKQFRELPDYRNVYVCVHTGEAGSGKTRAVYDTSRTKYSQRPYSPLSSSPEWWCAYEGEKVILIDDFFGQVKLSRLLRILDGYPILLPNKGAHTYSLYEEVHITTNQDWEQWYQMIRDRQDDTGWRLYEALKRRINRVIHYKK